MGRSKQIIVLSCIFIMLIACIYLGYRIKTRPEKVPEEIYRGSYKETAIALPVINEAHGEEYLQLMHGMNNEVELFTVLYNEDRSMVRGYKKYTLSEDLKWSEVEANWMALEFFSDTTRVIRMMSYAETGSLYMVLHDLSTEDTQADEVVRVSTSANVEHVGVRGLYKTDEDGAQIPIRKMFITNNTIYITDQKSNSYAYSLVSGELYASSANGAFGSLASDGNLMYVLSDERNAVVPYRLSDGTVQKSRQFRTNAKLPGIDDCDEYDRMDYQLLCRDGILYLSCQDGIYSYDAQTASWRHLIEGMDCLFGKPSVVQQDFIAIGDHLYMLGKDADDTFCLAMYDTRTKEEDEALNRTPFHISSYRKSAIILEAAVAFQHQNPSLKVIYDVALDTNPSLTIDEYRLQIQKQLTDNKAADILVCDELDYRSYMDSGLFENISDLMKPLYTASDLYGNITNAMSQGKIFVTPAKFDAFLHYGSDSYISSLSSTETIADASEKKGSPLLGSMTADELAQILCSFYQEEYLIDGEISKDALLATLNHIHGSVRLILPEPEDTVQTDDSADTSTEDSQGTTNAAAAEDLPQGPSYDFLPGIARISSTASLTELLTGLSASGHTYCAANGRFAPRSIVGINSKSANSKTSREFIRTMYSAAVQNTGVGEGIAMRGAYTADTGKTSSPSADIAEEEQTRWKSCLQALSVVYDEHPVLHAAFADVLPAFLADEITAEEAADAILNHTP